MMKIAILYCCVVVSLFSCTSASSGKTGGQMPVADYFNFGDTGVQSAGVRIIPITTPVGNFKVWTKRFGNNPKIKVLLLHGALHQDMNTWNVSKVFFRKKVLSFMNMTSWVLLTATSQKIAVYGRIDRFVEEVEQVRKAIGADRTKFYVLGNSWGGILGMQYALKYQDNMKA